MYICELCHLTLSRKDSLKRHKEAKHKNEINYTKMKSSKRKVPESNAINSLKKNAYIARAQYKIQPLENMHFGAGMLGEKTFHTGTHPTFLELQRAKNGFFSRPQGENTLYHGEHPSSLVMERGFSKDRYQLEEAKAYDESTLKWKHPFTCMIAGPTSCGKSTFASRFLKHLNEMVDTTFVQIFYCAPESSYPDLSECTVPVRYLDCIPNGEMFTDKKPRLIVIDDMMRESNEQVVDLFTKHSHHLGLSVIFITQNIFHKGKGMRDISLNSHYIVAYKSPRDRGQFSTLARQICPRNTQYANEVFEDATNVPFGYLVMDLTQTTPDHLRFRTNIFPDEPNIVYVPRNFYVK